MSDENDGRKVTHEIRIYKQGDENPCEIIPIHEGTNVDRVEDGLSINFNFDEYWFETVEV